MKTHILFVSVLVGTGAVPLAAQQPAVNARVVQGLPSRYVAPECGLKPGHFKVSSAATYLKTGIETEVPDNRSRALSSGQKVVLEAIEKTQALASIWFCVMRQPNPQESTSRHQALVQALCSGDPAVAAEAVREHIAVGMEHSLEILQPYFKLRKATGRTFHRSERRLKRGFLP